MWQTHLPYPLTIDVIHNSQRHNQDSHHTNSCRDSRRIIGQPQFCRHCPLINLACMGEDSIYRQRQVLQATLSNCIEVNWRKPQAYSLCYGSSCSFQLPCSNNSHWPEQLPCVKRAILQRAPKECVNFSKCIQIRDIPLPCPPVNVAWQDGL